jgi:hypothetical protein
VDASIAIEDISLEEAEEGNPTSLLGSSLSADFYKKIRNQDSMVAPTRASLCLTNFAQ